MAAKGRIELIIGPMFAGKTSELLRRLRRHHYSRKQCLVVKAAKDERYSTTCVSSHDKQQMSATSCATLFEVKKEMAPYHVIGIDEGQFFPDLRAFAEWAANQGKIVIIAALDGDFKRQPFGDVCSLIPLAEKVDKLTAVCMICQSSEASFSHRLVSSRDVELVGGADKYVAACRECYNASQGAFTAQQPAEDEQAALSGSDSEGESREKAQCNTTAPEGAPDTGSLSVDDAQSDAPRMDIPRRTVGLEESSPKAVVVY
jgi:thymidine kinase